MYNHILVSNIILQLGIKQETVTFFFTDLFPNLVQSSKKQLTPQIVRVTTHYEYALLSAKCYKDAQNLPLPENWELVITSDEILDTDGMNYSRDGFYAMVFVNHVNEVTIYFF